MREGNHHRKPCGAAREVEVEARADAALIKGLPAPDGGKRHRRRGHQTEAVNRSGINALHWELRGQAALIVTGNIPGNNERNGSLRQRATANELAIAATVAGAVLR